MTIQYQDRFKGFDFAVGADNSVVIGAHFQGKTHFAANMICRPLLGHFDQIVWDYHGNIHKEIMKQRLTPKESHILLLSKGTNLLPNKPTQFIHPSEKSEIHFEAVCSAIEKMHDKHITIDECHNYNSAHRIPPHFAALIRDLGNQNISYTCIFQRPAENHKSIISNAKHRFLFRFDVPNDVDYLSRWIGTEVNLFLPPDLRKFHKDEPQLPRYSFIYRNAEELAPVVVRGGIK